MTTEPTEDKRIKESAPKLHVWVKSTLGHGEVMCQNCCITNREAAVLGRLNVCDAVATEARDE